MNTLVQIWSAIPDEEKGVILTLAAGWLLSAFRAVVGRLLPDGTARRWVEAFDWLLHFALANSRALGQRIAPAPKKEKP